MSEIQMYGTWLNLVQNVDLEGLERGLEHENNIDVP